MGAVTDFPPYLSGLRLAGRRVVVVGAGQVAQRRVPQLIAVGADVHVVAPEATPAIEGLVGSGEVTWHQRPFADDDLDGAWYALALTADGAVNARVIALAEERRIFCVRSDDATRGTAWTPATPEFLTTGDGLNIYRAKGDFTDGKGFFRLEIQEK